LEDATEENDYDYDENAINKIEEKFQNMRESMRNQVYNIKHRINHAEDDDDGKSEDNNEGDEDEALLAKTRRRKLLEIIRDARKKEKIRLY